MRTKRWAGLAAGLAVAAALAAAGGPEAPRLLSPPDGMDMTDVASFFRWAPVPGCTNFEIQVARDGTFTDLAIAKRTVHKGFHKDLYFPKDVLPAGAYAWRVRGLGGGATSAWSGVRGVTVNTNHAAAPSVVRRIGPDHPLFLMRNRSWDPLQHADHVREIVPEGLGGVIVVDDIGLAGERVFERARRYQDLGLDFVIWNNRCQVPLSTIEWLFQNFSRCIGTAEGEHFDGITWERGPEGNLSEQDFVRRAWALCAKYGRFYFLGDGDAGSYRWPGFAQRERAGFAACRPNIVPMFKTTKGDLALHSYGAVQGLMVAGWAENCGTWVDEWIWPGCGFGKRGEIIPEERRWDNRRKVGTKQCPWTYDLQMWLVGIASGSTVFHLESAHQWTPEGGASANYRRFFLPFIRAVVEHRLLPSRAAFLEGVKLAVNPDPEITKGKHGKQYAGGYAFLKDLYGIAAPGDQDLIPNDSRYGVICLLPPGTTNLPGRTRIVGPRDLPDPAAARAAFNAAYPHRFDGDAFMWECDGTVIVTCTRENETAVQRFAMPLGGGLVRSLSGTIGTQQYLLGKLAEDGGSFWLQVNGEDARGALEVTLACERKPHVDVVPAAAALVNEWSETAGTLTLRLSHADGAVEATLR